MDETYAIMTGGVVSNVIVAGPDFISQHCPGAVRIDNLTPVPGIGWRYNGEIFIRPVA